MREEQIQSVAFRNAELGSERLCIFGVVGVEGLRPPAEIISRLYETAFSRGTKQQDDVMAFIIKRL